MKPRLDLFEERLTHSIIGSFYDVYNYYGFGFLESVYAAALQIELRGKGLRVERERRVVVFYKGEPTSWQRVDFLVEGKVIIEIKASERLPEGTEPVLRSYLKATKVELGLILHFGPRAQFRRLICSNT
jgi:GxxExxY protein